MLHGLCCTAETIKGSNLGMAGQITKMVQQHGDSGAVCVHANSKRTITVGIQLSLLSKEEQEIEAKKDAEPPAAPAGGAAPFLPVG